MTITQDITIICGPTAIGKSNAAIQLDKQTGAEIISADAYQVYKHMDIGTAKTLSHEQEGIPHHLIDILTPDRSYSVSNFLDHARAIIKDCRHRQVPIIICGGTGFYVNAFLYDTAYDNIPTSNPDIQAKLQQEADTHGSEHLFKRLEKADPASAQRIGPHNTRRLIRALDILESSGKKPSELMPDTQEKRQDTTVQVLTMPREDLVERINIRVDHMIENGLVDEVKSLLESYPETCPAFKAIGYQEVIAHLNGEFNHAEMVEWIKMHTRQFARRQMTWFKKFS